MAFSVVTVLRQSFRRLATGPALLLLLALAVVQTLAALLAGPVYRIAVDGVLSGAPDPVALVLNPLSLAGLGVVVLVAGYVGLVTTRVFATQWGIVEREHLTRSVVSAFVNWLVGAVVLLALVTIGLALLVVPGLFVLAVLLVALPVIGVEDTNVAAALGRSWRASDGNRTALAALALTVVIVNALLVAASLAVTSALDGALAPLGLFAGTVAVAVGLVFVWITMARTYNQMQDKF